MAEVKWQARRVSDGVLVDVTGDTEGTPLIAPVANALEGSGGAGVVASDGTDPIGVVTTLYISDDEPPAQGDAGNLWLQTDPNNVATGLRLFIWIGAAWKLVGLDGLNGNGISIGTFDAVGEQLFEMGLAQGIFRNWAGSVIIQASTSLNLTGATVFMSGLPTSDPEVETQLYTDGAPAAGVPKPLMVSGGPA